ncbi:MAG: twin-arginine translocase TatA/TatE family subunit [Campylobacteraceae bacterium]|jgi:sec-independent protein translocase protein TatA|nr:twin-arginine translocase TatA/TatE family subunit [Campylobacteraceae bacterium]
MLANIGWPGLLIILIIVVFLFGGRRIAEVAKGLGTGLKNFKQAVKAEDDEEDIQADVAQKSKAEKPKKIAKADAPSTKITSKATVKRKTKKTADKA